MTDFTIDFAVVFGNCSGRQARLAHDAKEAANVEGRIGRFLNSLFTLRFDLLIFEC